MARPLATACALAALAGAGGPTATGGVDVARPAFSRAEWVELVRLYARGERAEAIGELGAWTERDLVRQIAAVEEAARAAERCPDCPNPLADLPLRAAVMLHWDRDRAEQPPASPGDVEQRRRCPGPLTSLAGRLARVLSRDPATAGFARRFFRMVVLSCQWDACFADAERWASEAILLFPHDTELLVARGSVQEEVATIGTPCPTVTPGDSAPAIVGDASARRERFEKARQHFADALALRPGLGLARLRLARVLWRLGELEPARRQLEAALSSLGAVDHVYLARLFLGRIHQDAGRLEQAASEYRLAVALHPTALSAGTALSNVLLAAGDPEGARQALRQGLGSAGRRSEPDPLWHYLVLNAADLANLVDALHRESLE